MVRTINRKIQPGNHRYEHSNHNTAFERARWREAQSALAALGLTSEPLARSAFRVERARQALEALTRDAWSRVADVHDGAFAGLGRDRFDAEPEEIRLRLLTRALTTFGGTGEAPSLSQAETALANCAKSVQGRQSLAGCLIERDRREIRVLREPGRQGLPSVAMEPGTSLTWDNRFQVTLDAAPAGRPASETGHVRALGADGLAALRGSPGTVRLPARIARTLPSYWCAGRLVAVPHLGQTMPGFTLRFLW